MDLIRFDFCNPHVPQTLPGIPGYDPTSGFSAGIFYTLEDNESYLVAGEIAPSTHVLGLGLELEPGARVENLGSGEVGGITRHALRLYSEALSATSDTMKFVQLMNLIEFLASPFEFQKMQDAKRAIALHVAQDRGAYVDIMEDFKFLTAEPKKAKGPNRGLRHNVIHLGRQLEDLIGPVERREVFDRLFRYTSLPIRDMMSLSMGDWSDVEQYRVQRKRALGI